MDYYQLVFQHKQYLFKLISDYKDKGLSSYCKGFKLYLLMSKFAAFMIAKNY